MKAQAEAAGTDGGVMADALALWFTPTACLNSCAATTCAGVKATGCPLSVAAAAVRLACCSVVGAAGRLLLPAALVAVASAARCRAAARAHSSDNRHIVWAVRIAGS